MRSCNDRSFRACCRLLDIAAAVLCPAEFDVFVAQGVGEEDDWTPLQAFGYRLQRNALYNNGRHGPIYKGHGDQRNKKQSKCQWPSGLEEGIYIHRMWMEKIEVSKTI